MNENDCINKVRDAFLERRARVGEWIGVAQAFLARPGAEATGLGFWIEGSAPGYIRDVEMVELFDGYALPVIAGAEGSDGFGKTIVERLGVVVAACDEKSRMLGAALVKLNGFKSTPWASAVHTMKIMAQVEAVADVRQLAHRLLMFATESRARTGDIQK
jgi:hypothetical protein